MAGQVIAIIGLGLIGGSIAKALATHKGGYKVLGADKDFPVLEKAKRCGWLDDWREDPAEAAAEAEIVVFCVPVCAMLGLAKALAPRMKPGGVLTDVGSVKGSLLEALPAFLPEGVSYVGGHPMAGSEQSGLDASDASLFVGRPYVVIPSPQASQAAVAKVEELIRALRAVPVRMQAGKHDQAVAMLSHMPHVLSASLMLAAAGDADAIEAKILAAGCFRDMTRVSGADARMWADICLTNSGAILRGLAEIDKLLLTAKEKIQEKDEAWLLEFFSQGRAGREAFGMSVLDGRGE
jgi:prephenate dehydrogenase